MENTEHDEARKNDEIRALQRELAGARTRRPDDVDDILAELSRRGVDTDGKPSNVQTRGGGKTAEQKAAEKAAKAAAKQAAKDQTAAAAAAPAADAGK